MFSVCGVCVFGFKLETARRIHISVCVCVLCSCSSVVSGGVFFFFVREVKVRGELSAAPFSVPRDGGGGGGIVC